MRVWLQNDGWWWRRGGTAFLMLGLVIGVAAREAAGVPVKGAAVTSAQITSRFAIGDFDGDSRPDLATVQVGQISASQARYWIGVQLSTGSRQSIGVTAPIGGLQIAPRDVNGDNSLDLILTTAWLNQPVAVLLNDGHGNFTVNDPAAFPGIVWKYETSGISANLDVQDATAAILTRLLGGCEPSNRAGSAPDPPGLLLFEISHDPAWSPVVSVLGRAPPTFVLHV
jgi:hypothetical protein